jgi:hypothetical protein
MRQVGAFGAIAIKSSTDLNIVSTFSMMPCASNYSYRLPLRRCSNNSRLAPSSDLETLHRSFTTFTCQIVLRTSTYDRVNIKINLLGNFLCTVRSTDSMSTQVQSGSDFRFSFFDRLIQSTNGKVRPSRWIAKRTSRPSTTKIMATFS